MPKSAKNLATVAAIALIVSAGVVFASNNIQSVRRVIG